MSARHSPTRALGTLGDGTLADRSCASHSSGLHCDPSRPDGTPVLLRSPRASALSPAAESTDVELSPMPRAPPPTESAAVLCHHRDQHLHDRSGNWGNFVTPAAEDSAGVGCLGGTAMPSSGSSSSSAAWQSPCCQTEAVAADIIGSRVLQPPSASPAFRTASVVPSPSLPFSPPPSRSMANSSLRAALPAALPGHLSSSPNPVPASSGVGARSSYSCTSSPNSVERRSMTVALDEHPLASAPTALATESTWAESHMLPSCVTTKDGPDGSLDKRAAAPFPMFVHDAELIHRVADEEMKLLDDFRSGGGMARASVAAAASAVGAVWDTPSTPVMEMPSMSSQQPVSARRGSGAAIVSVRQVSSAAGNSACVPCTSDSGAALAAASTLFSPPNGEKAVQPTPYPVTSACSVQDWSSVPRLGFPTPSDPAVAHAEVASQPTRDEEERKREDKWYRLCRGVSLLASASPEVIVKLRAVARVRGIPHHLRGVMWLTLTGTALKVDENEYFCAKLLRRNGYVTGPNAGAIAADVQRTFPGHPYFSDKDVGVYKLTNVLHALCWRNPLLSYCQSFNFLAAFLLLVLDDEERTFWLLVHIFEELLPNDFYGETLLGANVEQAVLEHLVEKKLPRVATKFREAGLQVKTLVANWIMSLFVNVFPIATALHVWDYLFCRTPNPGERTPAHLEITLATLKYLDDAGLLISDDAGELLVTLRKQTACLYDAAALVRLAQTMAITPKQLHQLRRQCKPVVVEQMKAREQARAAQLERRVAQELRCARENALASVNAS